MTVNGEFLSQQKQPGFFLQGIKVPVMPRFRRDMMAHSIKKYSILNLFNE